MNFGFSNPIRVNELFRPILQELSLEENISFEKLKNKVLQNINRVNQNEPVDIIGNNLNFQILDKISEKEHIYNQSKLIEYVQHFFSPINYDVVSKLKDNQ